MDGRPSREALAAALGAVGWFGADALQQADAILAALPSEPPSDPERLDVAWAAAESALRPERGHLYLAAKPDGRFVAGKDTGDPATSYVYGPTPAAALRALVARLNDSGDASST